MPQKRKRGKAKPKACSEKLNEVFKVYEKEYGKVAHRADEILPVSHTSSGMFELDYATLGGVPDHYLTQYHGWESSAKSTSAWKLAVEHQIKYPELNVAILDSENHFDPDWAEQCGLDLTRLQVVSGAGYGETYADIWDALLNTGELSLIILDSIMALQPKDEGEKSAHDNLKIADRAAIVARMCSSVTKARQDSMKNELHIPSVLLINQWRNKAGFFMGSPNTLGGGNAPKFIQKLRVEMKRPGKPSDTLVAKQTLKGDSTKAQEKYIVMARHSFKIEKCKSGISKDRGSFWLTKSKLHPFLSVTDIWDAGAIIAKAKLHGFLQSAGKTSWLHCTGEDNKGTQEKLAITLWENPDAQSLLGACIVAVVRFEIGKPLIPFDNHLMRRTGEEIREHLSIVFPDTDFGNP